MQVSRVSRKGLTSIPVEVRRILNIEEGDMLVWEVDKSTNTATVKVVKNPAKHLRGRYSDPNLVYERVEETADKRLLEELHAGNRA